MISLKNITKSYGRSIVLSGLTLNIDPGSCVCICGDSGSGKSTLMRLLLGAERPDKGVVEIDGINMRVLPQPVLQLYRRRLGVIFQEPILVDYLTVQENVALPLSLPGAPNALITRNVQDLLKRLNLLSKADAFPKNLSRSEQSLVCIARAIISAPMVIIADEPLQHLDAAEAKVVIELLHNMQKKGTTVVLFARDPAVAAQFHAETILLRDGKAMRHAEQKTARTPAEPKRMPEEDTPISEFELKMDEEQLHESISQTLPPRPFRAGKRIRITSIGSNL